MVIMASALTFPLHLLITFLSLAINAETVLQSYTHDGTLSAAQSPYLVVSDVTFGANVLVTIELGVQITFVGDASITIKGSLNCGCSDLSILDDTVKGLADESSSIHITTSSTNSSSGFIIDHSSADSFEEYEDDALSIQFCNTLFQGTGTAITSLHDQFSPYSVYNAEFKQLHHALDHRGKSVINYVHDSLFHDVDHVLSEGAVIFDHCAFIGFESFSADTELAENIAVRDSEISNPDGICINAHSVAILYDNTISGCSHGIWVEEGASIRNNVITDCSVSAITAHHIEDELIISYNAFSENSGSHIVLQHVMEDAAVTIKHNEFYHEPDGPMNSSIAIVSDDGATSNPMELSSSEFAEDVLIEIAFNNFHDRDSVDWFVTVHDDHTNDSSSSLSMIDLNDNWWSGLLSVEMVRNSIDTDNLCAVDLCRVNQVPMERESNIFDEEEEIANIPQCSWTMTSTAVDSLLSVDCTAFTDYFCDDHAYSMSSTKPEDNTVIAADSEEGLSLRSFVVLTAAATMAVMVLCTLCVCWEYRSVHRLNKQKSPSPSPEHAAEGMFFGTTYPPNRCNFDFVVDQITYVLAVNHMRTQQRRPRIRGQSMPPL